MSASIAELVQQAVADGILTTAAPMNGTGTDYVSVGTADGIGNKDVKIGTLTKAQYGVPARVYVDVRIAHRQGQTHETTEHETVTDWWELSISGSTTTAASRRRDDIDGGGQCRDTVSQANGAPSNLRQFVKVWDAYHLTGMRAGCAHQTPVWVDGRYGREVSLTHTPPCPESGYRYGHKWLVADLPQSAVATVLEFLREARDNA